MYFVTSNNFFFIKHVLGGMVFITKYNLSEKHFLSRKV